MIRFFRTLRQRLLSENRVRKYLLYAVGEIVLVVIGILIALQINTWNQERQNRAEEQKYLMRLEQDLNTDLLNIQQARINYETRLVLGLRVLDSLGSNNGDLVRAWPYFSEAKDHLETQGVNYGKKLGPDLFAILTRGQFTPARVTFDELQNTGKISLIRDDSLRVHLQYHYPRLEEGQGFQEAIVLDIQQTYRGALFANQISTLNQEGYAELIAVLPEPGQLLIAIENYLRVTFIFLGNLYYNPDSYFNDTRELLTWVKAQLNPKPQSP